MVLFFIGAGVKVVIFDIGFLENYLYFKKGRIKDWINWINEKIFDDGKYCKKVINYFIVVDFL